MKTKSKIILLLLGMFWVWNGADFAEAQSVNILKSADPTKTIKEVKSAAEPVVVANVNISDASFSAKPGNILDIKFVLINEIGVQPGVKYGVELRDDENGALIDQLVYPETLFLGEKEMIKKEVVYTPPSYLKGKFGIWVVSENEQGLLLGRVSAGTINLSGDGRFVEIGDCSLNVAGDRVSYPLDQGVDVSPEEELTLACIAKNNTEKDITVIPSVKTARRTAFGEIISEENSEAVEFKKGTTQKLSLVIPKARAPQMYEVSVSFADGAGKKTANLIRARYVIRGNGATIQNAILNKDTYVKGDKAEAFLFWTGRTDNFLEARRPLSLQGKAFLKISAFKEDWQNCADDFTKELDRSKTIEKAELDIKDDCRNGRMIISILDNEKNVLAEETIEFRKVAKTAEIADAGNKKGSIPLPYLIAGILAAVGIAAIWIKKKKGATAAGTLMLLLFFGLLLLADEAKALTWEVEAGSYYLCDNTGAEPSICELLITYTATFNANLSPTSVCQNENITVDGSASRNSKQGRAWLEYQMNGYEGYLVNSNSDMGSAVIPAGSSIGSKSATFDSSYNTSLMNSTSRKSIGYSVRDCTSNSIPTPSCGDGSCNGSETCSSCPSDCGACAGCGIINGLTLAPEMLPPAGGGNYCNPDSGYVADSFAQYPGLPGQWWWQCGNAWCYINQAMPTFSCDASRPCPVSGGVTCGGATQTGLSMTTPWTYSENCDGSAKCQCDCPTGQSNINGVCAGCGNSSYNCSKNAPACSRSNCGGNLTGAVSCSYSNNCGTFSEAVSNGKCGNVACVPDVVNCDCSEWIEVAP